VEPEAATRSKAQRAAESTWQTSALARASEGLPDAQEFEVAGVSGAE